jgi:hypothetical protein
MLIERGMMLTIRTADAAAATGTAAAGDRLRLFALARLPLLEDDLRAAREPEGFAFFAPAEARRIPFPGCFWRSGIPASPEYRPLA